MPLLDHDFSGIFDNNCIKYAHYLDAIMETNDLLFEDVVGNLKCQCMKDVSQLWKRIVQIYGAYLCTYLRQIIFIITCMNVPCTDIHSIRTYNIMCTLRLTDRTP